MSIIQIMHRFSGKILFEKEARSLKMDGAEALRFWCTWKEPLRQICLYSGRIQENTEEPS